VIQNVFVTVVSVRIAIVRRPSHPFRLWRKIPFIRIEVSYQLRLDPRLSSVSPTRGVVELGLVSDLPAPGLPTAESRRAIWLPKHRDGTVSDRAHEIPLPTTEMSGARNENDPLIKAAELATKPAFVFAAHIGANVAAGNFAPVRVRLPNSSYANVRAVLYEFLSSEPVQIQFQSSKSVRVAVAFKAPCWALRYALRA
jgi:hypothetical protein